MLSRGSIAGPRHPPQWPYRLNRQASLARGLIGWWPIFNQGLKRETVWETGASEYSVRNYATNRALRSDDLLTSSNVTHDQRSATPEFGARAFAFAGAETYLRQQDGTAKYDPPIGQTGDLTVMAWVYVASDDATRFGLLSKGDFNNEGWGLYVNKADDLVRGYAGTWDITGVSTKTLVNNKWYRVGIRVHRVAPNWLTCEPIIDAEIGTTSTAVSRSSTIRYLEFGTGGAGFREWTGWIGHCCVWSRSLTQNEISRDWNPATRWELFDSNVRDRTFLRVPVVAGGLSIPVAMHEYRQRHQSVV